MNKPSATINIQNHFQTLHPTVSFIENLSNNWLVDQETEDFTTEEIQGTLDLASPMQIVARNWVYFTLGSATKSNKPTQNSTNLASTRVSKY